MMFSYKPHAPRLTQWAASTVLALASALVAAPAIAGKAHTDGLRSGETYSRFIVKYRDGSREQANVDLKQRSLDAAVASARSGKKFSVKHLRRMAGGADVVRIDRQLDFTEATTLMRQIAADPNVEYVEVDNLKQIANP